MPRNNNVIINESAETDYKLKLKLFKRSKLTGMACSGEIQFELDWTHGPQLRYETV